MLGRGACGTLSSSRGGEEHARTERVCAAAMGPDERRAHGSRRGVTRVSFGLYCVSGTTAVGTLLLARRAGVAYCNAPSRQLHRGLNLKEALKDSIQSLID